MTDLEPSPRGPEIGTEKPAKSALLELNSTDKGFLLPRLTENQKALIKSPAEGLMIYQTDKSSGVYLFQSGNWKIISLKKNIKK